MFGNYINRNKIRQPHMSRTGFEGSFEFQGGILVGNRSSRDMTQPQSVRIALDHTIVSGNFFGFTENGILVSVYARKTFVLNNEFQKVENPVFDWGAQTRFSGNNVYSVDATGEHSTLLRIPDSQREMAARVLPKFEVPRDQAVTPLWQTVLALRSFVSEMAYTIFSGVQDPQKEEQCAANLRKIHTLIKRYDATQGHLPAATFFPHHPLTDPDSLAVLLGKDALPALTCPTSGPDFVRLGLNYVWNQKLNGRRLADVADPEKTWLMMDFVGTHDYMCAIQSCGHRGGVNVLYADGTVKWDKALPTPWSKDTPMSWQTWANQ
jgi:prepilin-type processing-associated H-X9-DG protein